MNKGNEADSEADSWISYEDLMRLKAVDSVSDNEYSEIKTKWHIEQISICNISFECEINVSVRDWDTRKVKREYHQNNIIHFSFSHFEWIAEGVE